MNLFQIPKRLPDEEVTNEIIRTPAFRVERIISSGQASPNGFWYYQDEDEWVALLQGEALIEFDNGESITLSKGSELFIPARQKHRVANTSTTPPCIWLCVFVK